LGKLKVAKALVNNALGAVIEPINRDAITPFFEFSIVEDSLFTHPEYPRKGV
jgi:hypothetical protein